MLRCNHERAGGGDRLVTHLQWMRRETALRGGDILLDLFGFALNVFNASLHHVADRNDAVEKTVLFDGQVAKTASCHVSMTSLTVWCSLQILTFGVMTLRTGCFIA
jgi:hypothetical protein